MSALVRVCVCEAMWRGLSNAFTYICIVCMCVASSYGFTSNLNEWRNEMEVKRNDRLANTTYSGLYTHCVDPYF